jgi:hypothetical protein
MQIQTILNRVQKFKSFVYKSVRWVENASDPTHGGYAICSLRFRLEQFSLVLDGSSHLLPCVLF